MFISPGTNADLFTIVLRDYLPCNHIRGRLCIIWVPHTVRTPPSALYTYISFFLEFLQGRFDRRTLYTGTLLKDFFLGKFTQFFTYCLPYDIIGGAFSINRTNPFFKISSAIMNDS